MHGGFVSGTGACGTDLPDREVPGDSSRDEGSVADAPILHLASGVLPLVIDDRPVLFVEATQRLNALNGSAGMLVALLADGIGLADLRLELGGTLGLSAAEVDALLVDWSAQRVISASSEASGSPERSSLVLRAGARDIAIVFPDGAWGRELAAPYAHLPQQHGADLRVTAAALGGDNDLAGIFDGRAGTLVAREGAAPVLRGMVVDLALGQDDYIALHAASLATPDGETILLIGAPGAGKSTLAMLAAVSPGTLRLAGDDIVLFDPGTGLAMGLPLPLTIKCGSWDRLVGAVPGLADSPPILRADGQWLRYAPLPSPAAPGWRRVAAIVDLRREDSPGAGAQLLAQSAIDCLGRLLEEGFVRGGRCTAGQMRGLARMVDGAHTFTLHYAEAGQALPAIEALLA
jgi:hypothetical protein